MKNPELAKIYFMGLSDETHRKKNIERYLSHLAERYCMPEAACEEVKKLKLQKEIRILFFSTCNGSLRKGFYEV
ncbi:MAG: hypothetical protein NC341_10535 [Blautia sp.]|nr:hypothetical protein [Blautia sp.]